MKVGGRDLEKDTGAMAAMAEEAVKDTTAADIIAADTITADMADMVRIISGKSVESCANKKTIVQVNTETATADTTEATGEPNYEQMCFEISTTFSTETRSSELCLERSKQPDDSWHVDVGSRRRRHSSSVNLFTDCSLALRIEQMNEFSRHFLRTHLGFVF